METITTLTLHIKPTENIDVPNASISTFGPMLQSVLLSHASNAYAKKLHESAFHPYSQHCYKDADGEIVWQINALSAEAHEQLINPIRKVEAFTLRNISTSFNVQEHACKTFDISSLLELLGGNTSPTFRMNFITPTAFKSKGNYVIVPSVRLLFQNLLMRYNQIYAQDSEIDAETVPYIASNTIITSYNLRSRYFSRTMSKTDKIPAFVGSLTLRVNGPKTLRGLVCMLLTFAQVSGVGIKTAMGMGGFQMLETPATLTATNKGGSVE